MSSTAIEPHTSRSPAPASTYRRAPYVLAVVIAMLTAVPQGCAYGPGAEEATGSADQALNANAHTAFDYFLGKGLTAVQAAGIIGNLMQESNVTPTAVQPGGPGRGTAQWSAGGRWDADRGDNVVAYASSHGASAWSLSLQLDFIWYELTTFSGYGLSELRESTTVSAATIAFEVHFEGCGTCEQATRIEYANQALTAYGADATVTWGGHFVSQSFPYASAGAVTIRADGTEAISITMRNIGTHAWDAHTCIATTTPRDRTSVFAGSGWPAPDRPACVPSGTTVASGAEHTFTWTMHAPATAGRYDEHWGMVEDGVTWFSAAGEGGPPDDDLEGIFTVTPAPPPPDAGEHDAGVEDAGEHDARAEDAGEHDASVEDAGEHDASVEDAGEHDAATEEDAASADAGAVEHDAEVRDAAQEEPSDASSGDAGDGGTAAASAGCQAGPARGGAGSQTGTFVAAALAIAGARFSRRRRPG